MHWACMPKSLHLFPSVISSETIPSLLHGSLLPIQSLLWKILSSLLSLSQEDNNQESKHLFPRVKKISSRLLISAAWCLILGRTKWVGVEAPFPPFWQWNFPYRSTV